MNVEIIASGSSGNCAVIDDTIIIDAGWSVMPTGKFVLLTHHHTDHTKHLDKVGGLPVYCTQATADRLAVKFPYVAFNVIPYDGFFNVEEYRIEAVRLKHDAPCVGFDIMHGDERIFFATDFNEIVCDTWFVRNLKNKRYDAVYIECNNTLSPADFFDVYFHDEDSKPPKDEFHRRKSFQNHCNADYLIGLFTQAGYTAENRFAEPITLLHKSSFYYLKDVSRIAELCKIANVKNPMY
jgi:hypothetical protein